MPATFNVDLSQTQVDIVHVQVFSVCLTYRSTKVDRRRLQVAANAFEGCHALTIPGEICYLSMRGKQVTQRRISWGGREVETLQ